MAVETAADILRAARAEVAEAADSILSAAETGLRDLAAAREGRPEALDRLERTLCALLEACAFQDLVGQRLTKLEAALAGVVAADHDPLLAGPALPGRGLDQGSIDSLFAADPD